MKRLPATVSQIHGFRVVGGRFVIVVALLTLCSCATRESVQPKLPPEITMNKAVGRGDLALATLRLESGEELRFSVDTGAPITMFDKSLEPKLGKRAGRRKMRWSGGKAACDAFRAPKLFLGDTQLVTGKEVLTWDFKQLHYPGLPIMGVLGTDCLRHYCIQFDFAARKMRFLDSKTLDNPGHAFRLVPSRGCFEVTENLAGNKPGNTIIDTGCNFDGVLTPRLFRQWTNTVQAGSETKPAIRVGVLGGETYAKLDLNGDGRNNLLGLSFLARHLVTLDFPNRTMYLKRTRIDRLEHDYSFTNAESTIQAPLR